MKVLERNGKNIAIVLALLGLVVLYVYMKEHEYGFFIILAAINLSMFAFRRNTQDPNDPYEPFIGKPLEALQFTDSHLHINEHSVELNKIEKIVLELEQGQGILQLPYNNGGKINIRFPAKYLFKLKTQFQQRLPDVEYIS